MTTQEQVEAFLAKRPYYHREDVEHIAESVGNKEGIPFCPVCADWHETYEECSAD